MKEIYPEYLTGFNLQNTNKFILLAVNDSRCRDQPDHLSYHPGIGKDKNDRRIKSIGSTDWNYSKVFMIQGAYITIVGVLWGLIIGLGISFLQ
jgi:lipoprotein-releasing system permease protein